MGSDVNNAAYIVAGWGAFAVLVLGYVASLLVRGRRLSGRVPPERRRWSTTPEPGSTGTTLQRVWGNRDV